METRRTKNEEWIKVASRSKPGRFYLFNKSTGETRWIPLAQDSCIAEVSVSQKETPPKLQVSKLRGKNPAQDRLKRLQNNLKVNQIPSEPKVITSDEKTENIISNSEEQKNQSNDLPSTSSASKSNPKLNLSTCTNLPSPRKVNKRKHSTSSSPSTETEYEKLQNQETIKISRLSETLNSSSATNRNFDNSIYDCDCPMRADTDQENKQNDVTKLSRFNSLRTGIVNKIKEICKIPFSSAFKNPSNENEQISSSNLFNTITFKSAKKTIDNTQRLSASLQEELSQLRAEKGNDVRQYSTPKNLSLPTYQRGSANSRLERLRQSLQLQQPSTSATCLPAVYQTIHNSINDEVQAMDWQSTIKQEPIEISSTDCIVSSKFETPPLKRFDTSDERTMGDIYDTVNDNLLRFSAEKYKGSLNDNNSKWQKEYYYFIVDTNVLLRDLCFIDDLSKMKLCDTKGSILYIPYCVLQELDILKMRSGCQEGVKTLAVRAIKFLNNKFENKSNHLQAQSALEERNHLIEINSADDSIINCCLQAKEHVKNLLLLTEDVNLRNKAICNCILVSTKSYLVSKHYDTNNEKEKS